MVQEFVGRLPLVAALDQLSEDEMVMVLTETKNVTIKQYTKLMAMEGESLTVTKDALRAMLERIMLEMMYEIPSREDVADVTINRAVVGGEKAQIVRRKQDKDAT